MCHFGIVDCIEVCIEVCIVPFEDDSFAEPRNQTMPSGLQNLKKVTLMASWGSRDICLSRLYKVALLPNLETLHAYAVGYSGIEAARYDLGQREISI